MKNQSSIDVIICRQQQDQAIIFKDNNLWLLIDNIADDELDIELRNNLTVLNMLPISKVIVAKRPLRPEFEWILFDVYRLGIGDNGLELYRLGYIQRMMTTASVCGFSERNCSISGNYHVSGNFLSSRRRNLKGVSIICGLVVSSD